MFCLLERIPFENHITTIKIEIRNICDVDGMVCERMMGAKMNFLLTH